MARTVQAPGKGGQRLAEREPGWNRGTIRKGMEELKHGIVCVDACTMAWKRKHPLVELVMTTYQTGVKLTKEAMKIVETQLERWPSLEKWFVDIRSFPPAIRADLVSTLARKVSSIEK
jgi:hypothetical protein